MKKKVRSRFSAFNGNPAHSFLSELGMRLFQKGGISSHFPWMGIGSFHSCQPVFPRSKYPGNEVLTTSLEERRKQPICCMMCTMSVMLSCIIILVITPQSFRVVNMSVLKLRNYRPGGVSFLLWLPQHQMGELKIVSSKQGRRNKPRTWAWPTLIRLIFSW